MSIHPETIFGADVEAVAAKDALVRTESPRLTWLAGDGDGPRRATLFTNQTVSAFIRVQFEFTARPGEWILSLKRVPSGDRLARGVAQDVLEQLNHGPTRWVAKPGFNVRCN